MMKVMKRKLTLLLGLSSGVAMVALNCREADDRIGQVCVVPAPTDDRDQRLDTGAEIYVYLYLHGNQDDCISSTSLSGVPEVESVGPGKWKVVGGFVDASSDQPRTPDCNGGLVVATLGRLGAGSYVVESTLDPLRFDLPSSESRICVSRHDVSDVDASNRRPLEHALGAGEREGPRAAASGVGAAVYRAHWWPAHDPANRAWIASQAALLVVNLAQPALLARAEWARSMRSS
jgi:hypothetical protein